LPIDDRLLQAQAIILVATSGAFVLAALFAERRDYVAHLTRSNVLLARERDNKLINLQAVGASIAHEMKQPLTAIAANSAAALTFVRKSPPDLTEIEETLTDIVDDSHRASEALDGIRTLFRTADQGRQLVNVNEIALDVLTSLHRELKDHDVIVIPELASELPVVEVNKSQLQQVLLNLSLNAVEAMGATADGDRVLRVRTGSHNENTIVVTVQDSGPGIATPTIDRIFDGLVTTKARGMGLGLAICRMIVERHGGRLTASSDGKNGALFQFTLPVGSAGT
jgi:signal transduction histidine kinase